MWLYLIKNIFISKFSFLHLLKTKFYSYRISVEAGHWWLMPIISATWDAEIRRIGF
jgi:hypothetical protein